MKPTNTYFGIDPRPKRVLDGYVNHTSWLVYVAADTDLAPLTWECPQTPILVTSEPPRKEHYYAPRL